MQMHCGDIVVTLHCVLRTKVAKEKMDNDKEKTFTKVKTKISKEQRTCELSL